MNKETKLNSSTLVFTIIFTAVILGAAISTLAQSSALSNRLTLGQLFTPHKSQNLWLENVLLDDELPKPDFSAMEKWYETSNVEHDVFAAKLTYLAKAKKEENRPVKFWMQFLRGDGTVVKESYMLALNAYFSNGNTPNTPVKVTVDTPTESYLSEVKAVRVVRYKE